MLGICFVEHLESALYTSPQVNNAIIYIYDKIIEASIMSVVMKARLYAILVKTIDIAWIDQVSICLRCVDSNYVMKIYNVKIFLNILLLLI